MYPKDYVSLQQSLGEYIHCKNARIGVCLLTDKDTIEINGYREFPMLSIYKFPLALKVAQTCKKNNISFEDSINIYPDEIYPDTWSPLRDKYGIRLLRVSISELLNLLLQKSDNNACDILFSRFGGPAATDSLIKSLGFNDFHILDTEAEMHIDPSLCYRNRTTPLQLSSLFKKFNEEIRLQSSEFEEIATILESCETGLSRIPAGLPPGSTIGHKTGTGDINQNGRISAVNDAGYILLPDNRSLYLSIMIADAQCSYQEADSIIADITKLIITYIFHREYPAN